MAGRKTASVAKSQSSAQEIKRKTATANQATFADYFRFGESYTSLVLGIVVVIIASLLLVTVLRSRDLKSKSVVQETSSIATQRSESEKINMAGQKTYTIQKGDDLWKIAESQYSNGYGWVEIAKANNLSNPSVINVGSKLVIPDIKKSADKKNIAMVAENLTPTTVQVTSTPTPSATLTPAPTKAEPTKMAVKPTPILPPQNNIDMNEKISGDSYTVVSGDYLWSIAERAYGDGYKWVEIARANKIPNPDLIYVGTKLILPH